MAPCRSQARSGREGGLHAPSEECREQRWELPCAWPRYGSMAKRSTRIGRLHVSVFVPLEPGCARSSQQVGVCPAVHTIAVFDVLEVGAVHGTRLEGLLRGGGGGVRTRTTRWNARVAWNVVGEGARRACEEERPRWQGVTSGGFLRPPRGFHVGAPEMNRFVT